MIRVKKVVRKLVDVCSLAVIGGLILYIFVLYCREAYFLLKEANNREMANYSNVLRLSPDEARHSDRTSGPENE